MHRPLDIAHPNASVRGPNLVQYYPAGNMDGVRRPAAPMAPVVRRHDRANSDGIGGRFDLDPNLAQQLVAAGVLCPIDFNRVTLPAADLDAAVAVFHANP